MAERTVRPSVVLVRFPFVVPHSDFVGFPFGFPAGRSAAGDECCERGSAQAMVYPRQGTPVHLDGGSPSEGQRRQVVGGNALAPRNACPDLTLHSCGRNRGADGLS